MVEHYTYGLQSETMKIPPLVLAEPYRIFFPAAWLTGIIGVSYWLFIATGLTEGYAPIYHGLIQIELFCSGYALGFLLTAVPKFFSSHTSTEGELKVFFVVYTLLAATLIADATNAAQWIFMLLLSSLVRFCLVRFKARKSSPPYPFLLVAFGILEGISGALLFLYPLSGFPLLGQKLIEQGMFLSLSLGIGSFLGARLMGVAVTADSAVSLPRKELEGTLLRSPALFVLLTGIAIFVSFFVETGWHREAGLYLRGLATLLCLARFRVLSLPKSGSVAGLCVAVALWAIPIGTILAAFYPDHETGALHITYIGGFGLLILSIGAQVVSSHGAVHGFWHRHKQAAVSVGILTCVSALSRFSATFTPAHYFNLLAAAALCFDLALIVWGFGVLRYIASHPGNQPCKD